MLKNITFVIVLVAIASCGDNIVPGPDAGPNLPTACDDCANDQFPDDVEVFPDAGAPCPEGRGLGHKKHPDHKHCH